MVALPETITKTVAAIDAAMEDAQRGRHGYRIPASKIGAECERQLWYDFRWVSAPERHKGQTLRIFETGNVYEARIVGWLCASGQELVTSDGVKDDGTPRQIGVSFAEGHGFGYLDAEALNVPEAPTVPHVVEIKSHNDKSFAKLLSTGVQLSKPEHYGQFQIYMHKRGRTRALYVAINKNTDELHTERLNYDFEFCTRLEAKAERIAFASHAPRKLHEDPTAKLAFACGWCRHIGKCHGLDWPESNCRTCAWVTPQRGGAWFCERLSVDLNREEQELGCGSHIYLPELIPGEQVDAADDGSWIEYLMPDGTRFRDGATEQTGAQQ